jgi:hypothetical protein
MRRTIISTLCVTAALMGAPPAFAQSANGKPLIQVNQYLRASEYLVSSNGAFYAQVRNTGNICVAKGSGPNDTFGDLWCSPPAVAPSEYFAKMEANGRLCVYPGTPEKPTLLLLGLWCTPKGDGTPSYAVLQDNGNLAVTKPLKAPTWNSGATSPVTWLRGGKYIYPRNLRGQNAVEQLGWYYVRPNETSKNWYDVVLLSVTAEKFVLSEQDGTLRLAADGSKCVTQGAGGFRGGYQDLMTVRDCDSSNVYQKWRLEPDGRLRLERDPEGKMSLSDDWRLIQYFRVNALYSGDTRYRTWEFSETRRPVTFSPTVSR